MPNQITTMNLLNLLIFLLICFSSNAQVDVELFFWDDCKRKVVESGFSMYKTDEGPIGGEQMYSTRTNKITVPAGEYMVTFGREFNGYHSSESVHIQIKDKTKFVDTLFLPKIQFVTMQALHSRYWNYFKCEKLCRGIEVDHYLNGNKRLKGKFKKGKPIYIIEYRPNGILETKTYYLRGSQFKSKIEYYDEQGQLESYELYKWEAKEGQIKTTRTLYDAKGNFISSELE
jgi:hypothetical protein